MHVARAGTQRQQSEGTGNEVWWWPCMPGSLGRLQGTHGTLWYPGVSEFYWISQKGS